ncbi:4968_t:CDS:1 [Diversispora eburnea]|uniref:4968_t:CDS:1 n=1 Tax=Diversispora eburnea TaxID=1213867 RepID=A0A9N9CJ37_9GLOM|nr:4968_t:CDS:1 [Diversispora eburnea]
METKSLTNSTKVTTKKPQQKKLRVDIPKHLDINNVYNPKYDVIQLISTKSKLCASKNPPRPPNSYFLMKNCYMLELRAIGLRFTMPELCIQSKQLWKEAPNEVKKRYNEIQLKAQSIHNELYPEYKFRPRKGQNLKISVSPHKSAANITTFPSTNYLKRPASRLDNYSSLESEVRSTALSSSSDPLKTNYSLEISTPIFSDSLEYSPSLSNKLDQNYIDNDITPFSFSNEEFNESLESFEPSLDFSQNFQPLQLSYSYNPNEILNVSIGPDNNFFDQEQSFNLIENNENNGYEFFPFH